MTTERLTINPDNMSAEARWPIGPSILAALAVFAWGFFLFAGVVGVQGIKGQHVAGYPSIMQVIYYVIIPMGFCLVIASTFLWRLRMGPQQINSRALTLLIFVLSLVLLLPFMFLYGGGV